MNDSSEALSEHGERLNNTGNQTSSTNQFPTSAETPIESRITTAAAFIPGEGVNTSKYKEIREISPLITPRKNFDNIYYESIISIPVSPEPCKELETSKNTSFMYWENIPSELEGFIHEVREEAISEPSTIYTQHLLTLETCFFASSYSLKKAKKIAAIAPSPSADVNSCHPDNIAPSPSADVNSCHPHNIAPSPSADVNSCHPDDIAPSPSADVNSCHPHNIAPSPSADVNSCHPDNIAPSPSTCVNRSRPDNIAPSPFTRVNRSDPDNIAPGSFTRANRSHPDNITPSPSTCVNRSDPDNIAPSPSTCVNRSHPDNLPEYINQKTYSDAQTACTSHGTDNLSSEKNVINYHSRLRSEDIKIKNERKSPLTNTSYVQSDKVYPSCSKNCKSNERVKSIKRKLNNFICRLEEARRVYETKCRDIMEEFEEFLTNEALPLSDENKRFKAFDEVLMPQYRNSWRVLKLLGTLDDENISGENKGASIPKIPKI